VSCRAHQRRQSTRAIPSPRSASPTTTTLINASITRTTVASELDWSDAQARYDVRNIQPTGHPDYCVLPGCLIGRPDVRQRRLVLGAPDGPTACQGGIPTLAPVVIPIRGTCIVCTCHRLAPGETDPRVCRSVLSPIHGGSAATQNKRKPVSQWAGQGLFSDAARS
jgi:hypothetical protein